MGWIAILTVILTVVCILSLKMKAKIVSIKDVHKFWESSGSQDVMHQYVGLWVSILIASLLQ